MATIRNNNAEECEWVHLNTGKEFSRLLYTNPVSFLCTRCAHTTSDSTSSAKDDVMVLSWLTATNNDGRFMFSIHKSRYSTSLLAPPIDDDTDRTRSHAQKDTTNNFQVEIEFTLSVPIKGMEQMVLDVGSISGRYGSKISKDKHTDKMNEEDTNIEKLSNRQRKRQRMQQLTVDGVHGLVSVPFGNVEASSQTSLFSIKGTIAHLKCKTYAVMGSSIREEKDASSKEGMHINEKRQCEDKNMHSPIIDDDHLLIMAEVTDAYVHSSYWDDKKQLFRPTSSEVPPYLKFFGSQTFGYVTSGE